MTNPTEAAIREAFEAWADDYGISIKRSYSTDHDYYWNATQRAWSVWQAAQSHARAEMEARLGEIRSILAVAPDLNLKDYSKGQVEKLVWALQHAYALVSNEPPSLRGDERTTLAEPQPTGVGE
jgi:hypothetical protein